MGIEEIIAKHKEYLRKAQLDSLVKKSEAYKQAYAKPRHEALSQTQTQYEVSRRMLQNAGLASRRGNVVSGRENAIRAKLERFYRDYNAQLNNAAMERTEHDAQMMERDRQIAEQEASLQGALYRWRRAQQKAVRQQEQQTKKQQATQIATKAVDDVKETIKEKVKLAKEKAVKRAAKEKGQWQERQTDTHGGVEKTPVKESDYTVAMKYAMGQGAGKAEAVSFATQYVSEKQKEERAALAESTRKIWVTQSTGKDEKETTIAKKQVAAAERYITEHSQEWDTAISEARKATPRDSVAKMKGQRAQREKAQAMSEYARAQLAVSAPEEMEQLLLLPEKDFQQRYEAAVELVKKLRGDKQTMDVLRYDPQSGVDPLDHGESTDEMLKAATETLAQLERVQRLRTNTSADSMMFETFKADKGNIPEAPTYAMLTDKDGKNIQRAFDSGWDASDYRRTHDTKGSKYAALINEWSYINGRTALNYTQTHGVAKILRSVRDTFTKGESESWRYDSFIGRCAAEFYHDPEEGGTKAQREQMESMLTLANLMTEDERARYNTILKQAGATEADKYFEYLYKNILPERFDNYVNEEVDFQTRDAIGKVRESLMSVPMNMTQGISGPIYTLTSKQEDAVAAKLAAKKYDLAQGTRDRIGQQLGEVGSFLYGTGMSMVDSAVVAAISSGIGSALKGIGVAAGAASKIGSAVGGAILGGSAFNSTYNESLEKGLDPIKARATAIGSGINEMLFESLSIGTLLEVTGNETVKVAKNAFVNWIVNAAIQSGVEGSEEVFTDIGNRLWDNQVNKIFSEEQTKLREYIADGYTYDEAKKKVDDEFAQQLGLSFGGGALSGFVMGGGASAVSAIQTRSIDRLGKSLSAERIEDLKNFDYKSEEAQEILASGKLTNTDAGMLEIIRTQELTEQADTYIDEAVSDGKMPQDVAKLYKKFAENGIQTEENPNGITDAEAEQMLPYADTIKNAEAIKQGLGDIVKQQQEARQEFESMTDEQKQAKLQELGKVKGVDSLRVTSKESALSGKIAAADYAQKVKGITVKGDSVVVPKGSVKFDFDGVTHVDQMTDTQQRALRFASAVATKTGTNIKLENEFTGAFKNGEARKDSNGYYDYDTDTLYVNLSGDHSVTYTISHELTHMLKQKNVQGYTDLLEAVKRELSRSDLVGSDLPTEYRDKISEYLTGDNTLFQALQAYEESRGYGVNSEEEVVARCCESFLSNEAFVNQMCRTNEKSARAIYKFIQEIRADINALRNEAYERNAALGYESDYSPETGILAQFGDIDRIAKLWEKGLREVSKKKASKKEGQLSVSPVSDAVSSEMNMRFSKRSEAAPTKTKDVYKLMRLGKDGRLYPLFIDSAEGIDLGVWYNADSPDMSVLKTLPSGVYLVGNDGKDIVTLEEYQRTNGEKSSKFPSKAAINSAANDGKRWVYIEDVAKGQRRYGGENRKYWNLGINGSGSVSTFAMRPGWHAGSLPTMRQIGKGANRNLRDDSFVWVKGRVSADVDYQKEASRNPDNDIPTHIPTNGFYMKATNPNATAAQTDTVGWYIAGAFIADRIIGDTEARSVIDKWNEEHPSDHVEYDWERESGGVFDAESMSIRKADAIIIKQAGEVRQSKMDNIKLTETGEARTFEMGEVKARMYGNTVELEGGNIRQRVRMLQELAERYGEVTVDAASDEEADAFKRAGALRETELFSSGNTYSFEYKPSTYTTESKEDIRKKENFAKKILNEVGRTHIKSLSKHREELERAYRYMWNATHGKADQMAAYDAIDRMFDRILDDYSELPAEIDGAREALLKEMRVMRDGKGRKYRQLEVTPSQMAEIRHLYDSAKSYNVMLSKALGTRVFIKEVQGASMLENMKLTDVAENAPSVLLEKAQEVGKTERTNPYAGTSDERTAMKDSMWDIAASLVGGEKSTAQQIREAVKEVRKSERATAKEKLTKAVDDARLAERMHEGALRAQDRRIAANRETELKRRMVEREAKLKDVTQRTVAQQKIEMLRRDVKKVALKWNQKLVKMLANPTEASHVPIQLAREVAEFTDALTRFLDSGTERGQLNLTKIAKAYQQSFANEETIAAAKAENPKYDPRGLLPTSEYDDQLVGMINELNTILQGKTLKDLNPFEMQMLLNTVRGVAHTVYEANRMIGTTERKAIWKVGSKMVSELESAPKVPQKLRGYLETSLDLRRIARIFSGSNDNAEFVKLVDQLNQGAIEKERIAQTLQSIFKPVTDEYGKEIRKWYGKNAEWIDTGITKGGKKVEITKGMRVSLALHVLNEGNMRHIENGGLTIPDRELYRKGNLQDAYANGELVRLNKNQIEEIISHMTDAEKAYVEAAKELFHKRAGYYVNKTSLALLGYLKATVENYFPIHTDKNFTKTDFASLKQDGSIEGQGFLKERVMASNPVYLEDITSVVNRQIRGVALYAGLAIPMRNFNAVTNTSVYEDDNGVWSPRTTVKQTMTQKMGDYGRRVVEGFLTDVSEMSHVDVTPMERFAGKLASNYVKAVLLGNLKVALKQVASYPTAAAVIPWKYLAQGLASGKVDIDLINQYTPLYQMRREGQANEIASIMQKRGLEQKLPWLLGWITKMDVATVGRIWKAAEYMVADTQNIPVGSDAYYQAVAKVFNDTVQQTQPNFTPLQRNAALRSKNPIVRSLVLFGTQRMQNGGILMEAAMELKQSKGKSKAEIQAAKQKLGRAVASQIVQNILLIAASFGVDALRGRMKGWQDDDKEITAESLAKGMGDMFLSNAIGSFLGGSEVYDLVSAWYKKTTDETVYDTEFTVPTLEAAEFILNYLRKELPDAIKYMTSDRHSLEEKLKKAETSGSKLVRALGYATGIPFENAYKDLFKGIIPAIKDISDWKKTGELIPWLHQSGKLDQKKTSERYKEWVSKGRKGSEFFYIDNKLKGATSREMRIDVLAGEDIPAEEKAQLMVLYDSYGATCEGSVVYDKKGKVIVDFASVVKPSPIETTLDEIAEATAAPTPEPTESPLSEAKQEGVKQAVAQGVPEHTAVDAFVTYQDMGKNKSDDYSRNDDFREWLFTNVDDPHQRAVLEMQVIGQAASVKGAVTYRESGTVYRDYTDENWFKLSEHNLAKDGTNKRYDAGKKLEKTGLPVDKTVAIYEGLAQYTKKAEWTKYLKEHGLTDEQIRIFLWSRGWK